VHSPVGLQPSAFGPHGAQAWPRPPQALRSVEVQVLPTQQPVEQLDAQPLHAPPVHVSEAGQRAHVPPRAPHAIASEPATHVAPSQHPFGHVSALHGTEASGLVPPSPIVDPPPFPPATFPPATFPPAAELPPAAPPPAGVLQVLRHKPSSHWVVPSGHPRSGSGREAVSFEGSTQTQPLTRLISRSERRRGENTGPTYHFDA